MKVRQIGSSLKKNLLLISIITLLFSNEVFAQYQANHVIEVERFTNWAPDYLTIINTWNNSGLIPSTSSLKCLSVITEVNGQSTKDMSEEDFYQVIDNANQLSLVYVTKINGVNKQYKQSFTKRKGKLLISLSAPTQKPTTISLLSDNDVDFFQFNTFDYQLTGDDQLMDKTIMEVFANFLREKGLKRTTDKPDIILYVTKDVNQDIQSVYVPQYTTTTNTGSTGVGVANIFGLKGVNVGGSTGSATSVTKETGTMRTNVVADAYLQFSILDARKLDSKSAPIVWQLTYSEHKTSEIRLLEAVKEWIGRYALEYPFHEAIMGQFAYTWGVFCENFATNPVVSDIMPGSKAEVLGCKVGDEIKYVRYMGTDDDYCVFRPGQNFYGNTIISTTSMMQVGKKKIPKGGLTEIITYNFIKK